MGLSEPKGKHARGSNVQEIINKAHEADNGKSAEALPVPSTAPEIASDEFATTALQPQAPSPTDGTVRIEDYVDISQDNAPAPGVLAVDSYEPVTIDGVVLHKKRRVGKVLGITFGTIIGILLIAYIAGAIVFMGRFLPHTSIAGNDVSMMPNNEVVALLDKSVDDYAIDVVGNGFNYSAKAADIGLTIDSAAVVDAMHADLNAWAWPVLIFQNSHDESDKLSVSFKPQNYDYQVVNAVSAYNKNAVAPTDATITYDDKTKKFVIVDEVPGTQYDSHTILAAMSEAISTLEPHIKLTSDYLIQPNVLATDERLINSAEMATGLVSAHVTLTIEGKPVYEIDGASLSTFIRLDDNMGVTFDEAALTQWVNDLANGFDTVGTERTYTRPDGKVITVSGGAYGWITDASALEGQIVEAIKSGQSATIDIPCEQEAAVFAGPGQPDWGSRYIDVDLSEQYVRFYDGDSIIWESACISGTPDGQHNTWPGVWYITNKESPSKLIGYLPSGQKEYETTVSYWMAFEGNGIGLHDATWQPSFGGDMYMYGYGSHGCVNLPYDAAAELYEIANWGEVVIAHF